jgi:hypothetical protein
MGAQVAPVVIVAKRSDVWDAIAVVPHEHPRVVGQEAPVVKKLLDDVLDPFGMASRVSQVAGIFFRVLHLPALDAAGAVFSVCKQFHQTLQGYGWNLHLSLEHGHGKEDRERNGVADEVVAHPAQADKSPNFN